MRIAVIDDETNCRGLIKTYLERIGVKQPDVREAHSVESGVLLIESFNPDLVFLDIQMSDGTGFNLLEKVTHEFKLVFTTAFDNYAIRAFQFSALHYLLKPLDFNEFQTAWERAAGSDVIQKEERNGIVDVYNQGLFERIKLKTENDFYYVQIDHIQYIKAESSYCCFIIRDKKNILISKTLKIEPDMLRN